MAELSTKPYLIRAIHEWCTDNGYTPYLAVSIDDRTIVPAGYAKNGEIVLNVSAAATNRLRIDNDLITFQARFNGRAHDISVPVSNVSAIYARENGHGMAFEVTKATVAPPPPPPAPAPRPRPTLALAPTPEPQSPAPKAPEDQPVAAVPAAVEPVVEPTPAADAPTPVEAAPDASSPADPAASAPAPLPRGATRSRAGGGRRRSPKAADGEAAAGGADASTPEAPATDAAAAPADASGDASAPATDAPAESAGSPPDVPADAPPSDDGSPGGAGARGGRGRPRLTRVK